jgi:pimeloyl-ACP methyl ester carboxylesterase
VLLAGFRAAATTWLYQVPALDSAGFRVFTLDLRGHGTSEHPDFGHSMARRAADVQDFLIALDLWGVSLVGGSMGGNTIWAYLEQFGGERIRSIAIVDQTPRMLAGDDWMYGFYGYNEGNADTYFASSIPATGHGTPVLLRGMRLVRLLKAMGSGPKEPAQMSPGELELLGDHARKDWRAVIAGSPVPALFIAGEASEFWPSGHAAAAAALNPLAASVVIAKAGHATNIEQPKAVNAALLEWLKP